MKKKIPFFLLGLVAAAGLSPLFPQQERTLSMIMREKLVHSQQLLEAIVLENFDAIGENADRLARLTREANWATTQTPRFTRYSAEFTRILEDLSAQAAEKNLDGAALGYVDLTLKCVQCHRLVRGVERVSRPSGPPRGLARHQGGNR